ncbi:MAG: NAD(P)-dependent oxidoreductase [Melioribacteraceae bacterium]
MRVALIGTGLIGNPTVAKLLEANYDLRIYNRTKSKAENLIKDGAKFYADIPELINDSDVIISMLSDFDSFAELILDCGINQFDGKTFIQMSTIAPSESLELKRRIEKLRGEYIEAPILGSIPQIKIGKLIILVGSTEKQFAKWNKLFSVLGNKLLHIGKVGKASAMKLALNQLIISETAAFSMSLGYVRENNLDVNQFMEILRGSALYAPTFDKKLPKMLERNFENPNFPVKHLLKDLELMLHEFADKKINTNVLKGIRKIIINSLENGEGNLDYSAIYNSVHKKKQ